MRPAVAYCRRELELKHITVIILMTSLDKPSNVIQLPTIFLFDFGDEFLGVEDSNLLLGLSYLLEEVG